MRNIVAKSFALLFIMVYTGLLCLRGEPLTSGMPIEIVSMGELTYSNPVWVHPSNWKLPSQNDGPPSSLEGDYELMVGESPTRDPQRPESGCQLMIITARSGAPQISYNDPVTISALSAYQADGWVGHNTIFDQPRVWWRSTSARHEFGFDVFASNQSSAQVQSGQELFVLVSPTGKTGVVDDADVFWIVSKAPGAGPDDRVWPNEMRLDDPYYKLEVADRWGIEKGGGDRSVQRGRFKVQAVNREELDEIGRKTYDKIVKRQQFQGVVSPPQKTTKIAWFADRVTIGRRAGTPVAYCIDTNGDLFRLDVEKNAWFQLPAQTKDGKDLPLKDISMSFFGRLYALGRDGLAYRYRWRDGFFHPLNPGQGNESLTFDSISVGGRFNVRAVDLSTNTHYKYRRQKRRQGQLQPAGWVNKGSAINVAVGKGRAIAFVDQAGQAYMRVRKRGKGKRKRGVKKIWRKITGASIAQVAVASKKRVWGIDSAGRVWRVSKKKWMPVKGADGKQVSGFSHLDIGPRGELILASGHGDTYHRVAVKPLKKAKKRPVRRIKAGRSASATMQKEKSGIQRTSKKARKSKKAKRKKRKKRKKGKRRGKKRRKRKKRRRTNVV